MDCDLSLRQGIYKRCLSQIPSMYPDPAFGKVLGEPVRQAALHDRIDREIALQLALNF